MLLSIPVYKDFQRLEQFLNKLSIKYIKLIDDKVLKYSFKLENISYEEHIKLNDFLRSFNLKNNVKIKFI